MKILLVAVGSAGDVHPFVGLGLALRARGHDVTLITSGHFERLARQVGLDFVPFASNEDYRSMIQDPRVFSRLRGFEAITRLGILPSLAPIYQAVCQQYEPGRTVVVASTLGLGARIAQEKLGLPLVSVHLSPAILRSDHQSPVLPGLFMPDWLPRPLKRFQWWLGDATIIRRVLERPLNAFRAELGLPPVERVFSSWIHSPDGVLGLFPGWYGPAQPDWPPRTLLAGFPLYDERGASGPSAELARFVDAGDPPLVFTPGSAMVHSRRFFTAAAEACRLLGRRGLLLTRFAEQVPRGLPAGVRHFDFVPFSWLLPRAAALVSHGGIGTLSQGLAAGLPQLVMPMSHDQPDNAARLARLGVGASLRPRRFRGPAVAAALDALLRSSTVPAACQAIAQRIAAERPLEAACNMIESVARRESVLKAGKPLSLRRNQ